MNGVRVITTFWVIMCNTFINSIIGSVNVLTIDAIIQRPFILMIEAGLLTSDLFFFLGGFFLAYCFAKDLTPVPRKYFLVIFKRFLRILPCYVLTILIWYSMFMHLGGGPRWIPNQEYTNLCKNMWRTVLFVDNLINNGHTLCMSWTFYLQL
jgi:peptidoglycan/LPS O-acetylase OafA/YrhL